MNGALRGILYRRGDLIERRGGLLETCRLLLRAPRKIIRRGRNFSASNVHRIDIGAETLHRLLQLLDRVVEIGAQLFGFRREHRVNTVGEIAVRKLGEPGCKIIDRNLVLVCCFLLACQTLCVLLLPALDVFFFLSLLFQFLDACSLKN
jgi:hypothetical protein